MSIASIKKYISIYILELLFFMLPIKFAKIYLYMTVIAFINNIRNNEKLYRDVDIEHFNKLLLITLNPDVFLLPKNTYSIIINDSFLNDKIYYNDKAYTIKEIILDNKLCILYNRIITNKILNSIPYLFKLKLQKIKSFKIVMSRDLKYIYETN